MQRVASVKSVSQEKKEDEGGDTRGPESVERIWTEEVDGAWAPGKAPVHLLTAFLQYVQEDDVEHAEVTARESACQCLLHSLSTIESNLH